MSLVQFSCPESAPSFGEAHTFAFCVNECKNRCLSPFMLAAVAASTERNHHVGRYISMTSLKGCSRKLYLERNFDYAEEPKKVLYGYRGSVMHSVLEDAASWKGIKGKSLEEMGYLSEWQMKVGFCFKHGGFSLPLDFDVEDLASYAHNGCPSCNAENIPAKDQEWFALGGTLDGAEPLWDGGDYDVNGLVVNIPPFTVENGTLYMVLSDLKTFKDYAVNKFIFGDEEATLHTHAKDEHYSQMQGYRYLAERSIPPKVLLDKGVKQIRFVEARIQAFSMGEFPYMGTSYRARKHWKHDFTNWKIPTIEFENDQWVEDYIRTNARDIYDTLITGRRVPPVVPPTEGKRKGYNWLCDGFCAFNGSEYCPDPAAEWERLQEGKTQEEAYEGSLNVKDT